MARESKTKLPTTVEQEEMTVVILRFKGGGETLRKGFATVSDALAALGPPISHRKLLASRTDATPESDSETAFEPLEADADGAENSEASGAPERQGSVREYNTPEFLSDFILSPPGKTPWKEYATARNPQSLNDKYLTAAAWLTEQAGLEIFSRNHVFTCFRAMGWETQRDFTQPLRRMKSESSYFTMLKRGQWKITSVGLDKANGLPRAEQALAE